MSDYKAPEKTLEALAIDLFCCLHTKEIETIRGSLTWNSRTAFDALAEKALGLIKLVNTTHHVVSVTRSETKKRDPMWKMTTSEDIVFFAFSTGKSATLLQDADYYKTLNKMQLGDTLYWDEHPIGVALSYDGKYWNMVNCIRRHPSAEPNIRKFSFNDKWVTRITSALYCVIDFETTGTNPIKDEIVEVGAYRSDGRMFMRRVRPQNGIPTEATAIHGIKTSDVEQAPTFAEIYPELMEFIGTTQLVAYNAEFETAMLKKEIARMDSSQDVPQIECAMKAYSNGEKYASLAEACRQMGINPDLGKLHHATDDSFLTVKLIEKMRMCALSTGSGNGDQ